MMQSTENRDLSLRKTDGMTSLSYQKNGTVLYLSLTESWLCSSSMGKKVQKWQFRKIINRKINEHRGKGLGNEFLRVSSILINGKQPLSSRCRVVN